MLPAGGHEDVMPMNDLLAKTTAKVKGDTTEWFPASFIQLILGVNIKYDCSYSPDAAPGFLQNTQTTCRALVTSS